jgi:hypothetical protein
MSKRNDRDECNGTWQVKFVAMLPEIQQRLRRAFRLLNPASREDAVDEGVIHCLLSYARLHARGGAESATPSTLAWYAALQVKKGRPAGTRMNNKEILSRYGQLESGIHVESLHTGSGTHEQWIDALAEDKRASVADQVAAKMDVGAWFATLTRRMRQIAKDLALGFSTSEVARKHGVTPGRISQLRRELHDGWLTFQGELSPVTA